MFAVLWIAAHFGILVVGFIVASMLMWTIAVHQSDKEIKERVAREYVPPKPQDFIAWCGGDPDITYPSVIQLPRKQSPVKPQTKPYSKYQRVRYTTTNKKRDASGFVYLLKATGGYWKIGRTVDPDDRLRTFSVKLPFPVEYDHLIPCKDRFAAERKLHERYAAQRINGSEFFNLTPEQVDKIKSITSL